MSNSENPSENLLENPDTLLKASDALDTPVSAQKPSEPQLALIHADRKSENEFGNDSRSRPASVVKFDHKQSEAKTKSQNPERRFNGRCSPERLSGETSRQERRELAAALAHSLRTKISEGKSVYLDGLGVLFPEQHELPRAYILGKQLAVRRESISKLNFERAGELSPFIRDRYHSPLELSDLYLDVYRHLPLALQVSWAHAQMKFYLGGLISLLRREIVIDGFSHRLNPFCSFFSLHNRHGDSTVDWFAGADIFVHSDFEQVKRVEQPKLMERAKFNSVSEFGEVALGTKLHVFPLNISQALNDIGIGGSRSYYPDIEVIVLERAPGRLAFLTNGARAIQLVNGELLGAEFVIDCDLSQLSAWPFTVIAAVIEQIVSEPVPPSEIAPSEIAPSEIAPSEISVQQAGILSRPSGIGCVPVPLQAFGFGGFGSSALGCGAGQHANSEVKNGVSRSPAYSVAGSSVGGSTVTGNPVAWGGALVSQSNAHEQILLEDGTTARLLWITPLQEAERIIAERRTPEHIAALLVRKGVMLVARLNRASVLFRTEIL